MRFGFWCSGTGRGCNLKDAAHAAHRCAECPGRVGDSWHAADPGQSSSSSSLNEPAYVLLARGGTLLEWLVLQVSMRSAWHRAPHASLPAPGSADLCFLTGGSVESATQALRAAGVDIEDGPVKRTGARGPILSIYLRDPDGNLLEVSEQL